MQRKIFDGLMLKQLIEAGTTWLRTNSQTVNALNVFPVPDGDTGTNMLLTMTSAYNEIDSLGYHNAGQMAAALAQGALMGARGNSGVILSQLWRGFSRALHGKELIDAPALAAAFAEARDTAYKGVVRPVEGTILTVSKDIATEAEIAAKETEDPFEVLRRCVAAADRSVESTPNYLPILKQAGVVDSGGKGLFFILEGMTRFLNGESLESPILSVQPLSAMNLENAMEDVEAGQDWEVVVDFRPANGFELQAFYARLEEMGTSRWAKARGCIECTSIPRLKSVTNRSITSWGWGPSPRWPWKTCWPRWMTSKPRSAAPSWNYPRLTQGKSPW